MKVILQQDVAKLGRKNTVVEVPNGFALNSLIPTGKAVPATDQNLKKISNLKAVATAQNQDWIDSVKAVAEKCADVIQINAEVNDAGNLFAALSANDVVSAINEKLGSELATKDMFVMVEGIKSIGEYDLEWVEGVGSLKISVSKK